MTYLYQNPLIFVAILTILLSPFVLKVASKQDKKSKQSLKYIFLATLSAQIILGFFNWENFSVGRNGFELAFNYPQSFLGIFFIINLIQLYLLIAGKKLPVQTVALNFINTIVFIAGMIRLGQITGTQAVSWANIGTIFAVLTGNVIGLILINKDKNLLKKYFK